MNTPNVITTDYLTDCIRARKFEWAGEWDKAKALWKHLGRADDVAAIEMIQESTRKGDKYRELVKDSMNDYENRKINIYQLTEIMNDAWRRVYGN